MPLFTLSQKIFVIKNYYTGGGSLEHVQTCLAEQYSQVFSAGSNLPKTIMQIVNTFERTGSVLNRMYYDLLEPKEEDKVTVQFTIGDSVEVLEASDIIEEVEIPENNISINTDCDGSVTGELVVFEGDTESPVDKASTDRICQECGESVPRKTFWKHRKTHQEQKPLVKHKCDECVKEYRHKNDLLLHKKIHHSDSYDVIICEICGKESTNKYIHKCHMLVHSGRKDFACEDCPMKFMRIQGLRRHRLTHTGEKPLICKYCGAGFAAHMTLTMHMRLHTGERPYLCKHCGKAFIGQPALNSHLKQRHAGGGEYERMCRVCGGQFKTEKTLSQHMLKKHNIEPNAESELDANVEALIVFEEEEV